MTMRRYAVILPVLIVLLAAAIFIAANGQEGAQAETKAPVTQVTPTATPESTTTPDTSSTSSDGSDALSDGSDSSSSDSSSSDDPESSIGSGGSDTTGGTVLDGVGDTENVDAGNRLSSAKVIRQNVNDDEEEYAR